jgi:hypothetical protein
LTEGELNFALAWLRSRVGHDVWPLHDHRRKDMQRNANIFVVVGE